MRVYLDNCCLQRPLDNQTQPRIRVETEAVFAVLAAVQAEGVSLLDSEALRYEISRIPDYTGVLTLSHSCHLPLNICKSPTP